MSNEAGGPAAPAGGGAAPEAAQPAAGRGPDGRFAPGQQPAAAPGETRAETKARMLQYPANGRMREINLDDTEGLKRRLASSDGINERLAEARQLKEQADATTAKLRAAKAPTERLEALMAQLDLKSPTEARAWLEATMLADLQEEALPPEEKRQRDLQRQQQELDAKREAWAKEQQQAAIAAEQEQLQPIMGRNLAMALEAEGLPLRSPAVVDAIKPYLAAALEAEPSLDFRDPGVMRFAAQQARRELEQTTAAVLTGLDAPRLKSVLGEKLFNDLANVFRQGEVAALKTRAQPVSAQRAPEPPPKEEPYISMAEAERRLIAHDNAELRRRKGQ